MLFSFLWFLFSSRRRHTRCALVTGVQTCALPIYDIFDPNNGGVQAQVALGDAALLDRAVAAAKQAQPAWAAVNPQRRARVMFDYKRLVEAHLDELAELDRKSVV